MDDFSLMLFQAVLLGLIFTAAMWLIEDFGDKE